MLWKRIAVRDHERIVVAKNAQFHKILTPGTHYVFALSGEPVTFEKFDVRDVVFQSRWADYLVSKRPDVIERHFTLVETNEVQVAMVYTDGTLFNVLAPVTRALFWRGSVEVTTEIVAIIAESEFGSDERSPDEALIDNLVEMKPRPA
jgi:hypothetical protein